VRGLEFRLKIYQDPDVRLLLSHFLSGELSVITPVSDPTHKLRYPSVEDKLSVPPERAVNLLKSLADAEILKQDFFKAVLVCPHCSSFRLLISPLCPHCKAEELIKNAVYEHIPCGHIGLETVFTIEGKLMCQRCDVEFKKLNVDYRTVGIVYRCKGCGRSFDLPDFRCDCQECDSKFFLPEATFSSLHQYRLNEALRDEIFHYVVSLEPIREVLVEAGFTVEIPGRVAGASGVNQRFDIVARYPGMTARYAVIDVASAEAEVPATPLLSLFAKSTDVKPVKTVLIALPKLKDEARSLASTYKIACVEGADVKEIADKLGKVLKA
jgi:transposase-like protein